MSIEPERAAVTPRVVSAETGDELPVDESFLSLVDHEQRRIEIVGGPGSGKTTTLRHLAAVLPESERADLVLLDVPTTADVVERCARHRVIHTTMGSRPPLNATTFRLVAWTDDDLIAYLLARHSEQCRSVMNRLAESPARQLLAGLPALWRVVLERMVEDPALKDVRDALRVEFRESPLSRRTGELLSEYCLAAYARDAAWSMAAYRRIQEQGIDNSLLRLLRHDGVKTLLAADRLAEFARQSQRSAYLGGVFPAGVVAEVAEQLAANTQAMEYLGTLLVDNTLLPHAFPASVLHAVGTGWRPIPPLPRLARGQFSGASWEGIDLSDTVLDEADFCSANLAQACLDRTEANGACFRCAVLSNATLCKSQAVNADFVRADLSGAKLGQAWLAGADLTLAKLNGANLSRAVLEMANLTDASCRGTDLGECNLRWATLQRTDLREADLRGADLRHVRIEQPNLAGARLCNANLEDIDLEYARLPGIDLYGADLRGAFSTGSVMTGADLRQASLREAALADVDFEGADLRQADFTNAAFHMGSSRSGLVDSPLASEGTRTGFYTDDYQEQHFKSPEEIRKANLRGTDVRGARVTEADFYLVDLRGAKYTPDQAEHFRRCRAILDDPT